jgi:plastocyanin
MTARLSRIKRLAVLPPLLALGAMWPSSVSAGNPCFHDFIMPPTTSSTDNEIKLLPCAFAPTVTHVAIGSEVTFLNGPDFSHLITGANQEWGSPEVELQPGTSISYTFDTAGIYPYACVLHPGMSGSIVVGALADVLASGTVTGGSTGTSSDPESSTVETSTTASTARDSTPTSLLFVVLGIGAGLIAGATAVWFSLRRRSMSDGRLPRPVDSPRSSSTG